MKTKSLLILACIVVIALILVGCGEEAQYREERFTNEILTHLFDAQPPPRLDWSLERDIFIQLYKMRNDSVATYTLITSQFGDVLYECPSIGYPLAADYQLTNPLQVTSQGATIEMAEPNGMYSSKNTAGTWIMCVLEDGSIYPVYTELNATAWPFPVVAEEDKFQRYPAEGTKPSRVIDLKP